ncbi:hypothetical protein BKA80DRAFT_272963 [Phyllosticta citrichinensis]
MRQSRHKRAVHPARRSSRWQELRSAGGPRRAKDGETPVGTHITPRASSIFQHSSNIPSTKFPKLPRYLDPACRCARLLPVSALLHHSRRCVVSSSSSIPLPENDCTLYFPSWLEAPRMLGVQQMARRRLCHRSMCSSHKNPLPAFNRQTAFLRHRPFSRRFQTAT